MSEPTLRPVGNDADLRWSVGSHLRRMAYVINRALPTQSDVEMRDELVADFVEETARARNYTPIRLLPGPDPQSDDGFAQSIYDDQSVDLGVRLDREAKGVIALRLSFDSKVPDITTRSSTERLSHDLASLLDKYEKHRRRAMRVTMVEVTRDVEAFVRITVGALRAENSVLAAELHAAHLRIEFLEYQIELLTEANRLAKPGLVKGLLAGISSTLREARGPAVAGMILLGVGSMLSEPPSSLSSTQLVAVCEALETDVAQLTGSTAE